ncbi:unnamed protein product [Effrenium voratum]|uniref:DUF218 domain-containing protein n=1 Tax=Effrenium voratum TaxID=2562239 RepID=A0AA36HJX8_9DINO|nr:unnamed protein product [Effrenium voratum]
MHVFEDWSPHAHDGKDIFGKDASPLPFYLVRRNTAWLKGAQMVTLALSLCAAASGLFCWQKFANLQVSRSLHEVTFDAARLKNLSHLVLVAGHAVLLADSMEHVLQRESDWFLEPYQRGQDLPKALVSHIKSGVDLAALDPRALLVFSGGQTRAAAGPRDEGWSYYRVAEYFSWWGHATDGTAYLKEAQGRGAYLAVAQRTVTEDFALDSFQNLLFSLCRFKEVVGHYPERVTVVSFTFKKRRFSELHRRALSFPASRFFFVGIQPPPNSRFDLQKAEQGELQNSVRLFEEDPYGCNSKVLVEKRQARNPFQRTTPYLLSCPEIRSLLQWCGPGIFPDALPWSPRFTGGLPD